MLNKIRRILIIILMIIVCYLIQNTIAVFTGNIIITPNLIIILTCLFGFMSGYYEGILVGFLAGMIVDIFSCDIIGMNALLYMYIGFLSGIFNRIYYEDMVMLPISIIFVGDFLYNFSYYILRFLVRNKLDFSFYAQKIVIPEMILTTIVGLFIFKLIYAINSKWLVKEQRSTLNFD